LEKIYSPLPIIFPLTSILDFDLAHLGALEAFIEARVQGLVRFLGVTRHGSKVPEMHRRSLEHFDFDTVLLPYSYWQMQNPRYAADFNALVGYCLWRDVAVQTIKSVARRPWEKRPKTYNTYFYESLETEAGIEKSIVYNSINGDNMVFG
jgi:hypothetical protein